MAYSNIYEGVLNQELEDCAIENKYEESVEVKLRFSTEPSSSKK
jgi:hypothetical protein